MSTKRDYYEILGLSKDATESDIKKAYRTLAKKYHPDVNKAAGSEDKFKEINEAYEILSDPQKKASYDQFGHAGMSGAAGGGGGFGGGMSMDDIFSQFGDIFGGGGFGGFGGFGGSRGGRRVNRGSDLRVRVKLNLKEILNGVDKKIKVKKYVSCSHCKGNGSENGDSYTTCNTCKGTGAVTRVTNTILGQMQTSSTCSSCDGEGKTITTKCTHCSGEGVMRDDEVITIQIPAGVAEGMQLSMSGKGNAARRGGVSGDLLIIVEEEQHPDLIRDENDLIYNLFLSFPTAALGGSVEVPTVDGVAKMKIDAGTQPGKVLRLRNKGLPSVHGYGTGDLLINVNVYVPEKLNDKETKIMKEWEKSASFEPSKSAKKTVFSKFRKMFD